ncbi:MAG: AgmX/PglI C-terminal domain-containing protein [Alphaproteobacteria bacterium]|nr:AgmX/PglI C-terminal domain-containing protein [Alphaproteobacteria bacterium]
MVGKTTLFEYYDVSDDAPNDDVEQVVRKRRSWAQGQQANPKYRNEALWLIKHNALLRRVLLEQRDEYTAEVSNRSQSEKLSVLSTFIEGVLSSGVLTRKSEAAILDQGRAHGLPDEAVTKRIDELLDQTGAQREVNADEAIGDPDATDDFIDFYRVLDVSPEADAAEIEQAHRTKYRWARNLKDKEKVATIYAQLDAAWRVLKVPEKRAAYDAIWRARQKGIAQGMDVAEPLGFLPGAVADPDAPTEQSPPIEPPTEPAQLTPRPNAPSLQPSQPPQRAPSPVNRPSQPTPTPAAPPPPPPAPPSFHGVKQTLPSGRHVQPARRSPRLAIASPELVVIKVNRKPVSHKIVVKNAGRGKMPGRITSDRDWLTVKQSRLDPDAAQQEIEVIINPAGMPRNKSVALVTVVTDYGDRRGITLRVERQTTPVALIAGAAVIMLLILIALASVLGLFGGEDAPPAHSSLEIHVDPSADEVLVDGQSKGKGNLVEVSEGLPESGEVTVEVKLDGFKSASKKVKLNKGEESVVDFSLDLESPIGGAPRIEGEVPRVNAEMASRAIERQLPAIQDCMTRELTHKPGFTAELVVDIFVNSVGTLVGVAVKSENYESDAVLPCVKRQLRAVRFPTVDGAEYGALFNHTFTALVTSGSG